MYVIEISFFENSQPVHDVYQVETLDECRKRISTFIEVVDDLTVSITRNRKIFDSNNLQEIKKFCSKMDIAVFFEKFYGFKVDEVIYGTPNQVFIYLIDNENRKRMISSQMSPEDIMRELS